MRVQSGQCQPRRDRGGGAGRRATGEPGVGARGDAGRGSPLRPQAALRIFSSSVAAFTLLFLLSPLGTMHKRLPYVSPLLVEKGRLLPAEPPPQAGSVFLPPLGPTARLREPRFLLHPRPSLSHLLVLPHIHACN